jgi:L-fuculose-phosphate aldolase
MRQMQDSAKHAKELVLYCKLLYHRGYIAGIEGNLSVRLSEKEFMITPGGMNKGLISDDDMVTCDMECNKLKGSNEPSSEVKIHAAVYKSRDDAGAVCHAHPAFATAFSLLGESFDEAVLPEFVIALGSARLVRYATPGSDRLASNLLEVLENHDAFLLEKHGTLTLGHSMLEAFNRTEILERFATLLYYARRIEPPKLISREETERLLDLGGRLNLKGTIVSGEED